MKVKSGIRYVITAKYANGFKCLIYDASEKFTAYSLEVEESNIDIQDLLSVQYSTSTKGLTNFLKLVESTKANDEPWYIGEEDSRIILSSIRIQEVVVQAAKPISIKAIKAVRMAQAMRIKVDTNTYE